ncbi:MAG TPA: DsbA family protein [Terriglobales bacterium]
MLLRLKYAVLCLVLTAFAAAQKPAPAAKSASGALPSEETVNAFMQATFGYDPGLSWKISDIRPSQAEDVAQVTVVVTGPQGAQPTVFYVTGDGKHAFVGQMIPFGAHPFEPVRDLLQKKATGPSRGPASSPVTIVEFSDLQCPHCKAAQPMIEKLLADEPNARLVFQSFPLPMHDWAAKAAAYADCIGHRSNDAFWKFVQGVYDAQSDITAATADEKLTGIADAAGVKGPEIAACSSQDETVGRVQASIAVGKSVDVEATPTLFVNGRRISNLGQISADQLKALVEFAAKGGM